MKNIKAIILVIILLLTMNVKADSTCDSKEFKRLKDLAKKIEFDYGYTIENEDIDFYIHAVNLNEDLKVLIVYDYFNDDYKEFVGKKEATLNGFKTGEKVIITISGFVPNSCSGEVVLTKTIRLPYYNLFYDRNKCVGNEDFKYCKELINDNITQSDYDDAFELYLKNKEESKIKETYEKEVENTKLHIIIGSIVVALVLISALVIYIIKRIKKNSL